MFSCLSSFHSSFSSPQPFFTNTSVDLFPLSEFTPDNELAQSAPTSATSDQSSISYNSPKPTLDTPSHRSTRVREPPIHLQDYHCFSTIVSLVEPTSYPEASTDPLWQKSMNDELQALEKTHTWDYVDLPPGKRPIGYKWIYKIKTHSDGTIERYKARLVPKGYSQEYGIDYEETFAPMAWMTSVRSLLVVVAAKQWPLLQMDVKNAFLNETLSEEVYMKPPYGTSPSPHKVCLLHRALYGLKQTPRAWFATFSSTITQLGFTSSPHDTALFTRHTPHDIVLLLYVDDMIITVYRRSNGYLLSQAKYASDLLVRSRITNSNIASTSLDLNVHLTPYDGVPLEDVSLYRQLVGSLIYLTVTRPDIAYVVHIVRQFMTAPRTIHFTVIRLGIPLIGILQQGPTLLHCDNRSVIQIAHNNVFHERTKHIENDCHFIRHHLLSNILLLQPVSTTEQPADIFTKALPSTRFNQLLTKLKPTVTLPP
ncbi:Retrovirus-related Pol polyprotein from transposon TNT 1-94 [Cucumis melo var. makuwa]|uniref:Retrovirus-related Pol polyprotein from transposon TNT 1-94 n=1 Tax=Cucumis melo var. makuwa TaxID=1194695 RepID=A0A5D3BQV0_CUCMM|nr:Retrovirus-related Pol polyprotein from transposon TNT 1-94 [Cucumis melo var. makuwa]TYK01460.1 Retrovirus-related Pol polyprotein from transposon TNT 1-94 [Cucumis melo var. makuwa]